MLIKKVQGHLAVQLAHSQNPCGESKTRWRPQQVSHNDDFQVVECDFVGTFDDDGDDDDDNDGIHDMHQVYQCIMDPLQRLQTEVHRQSGKRKTSCVCIWPR